MESKYYTNPFRDDDDEACYAEIDMVEEADHGQHDAETMPSMSREQTTERISAMLSNTAGEDVKPNVHERDTAESNIAETPSPPLTHEHANDAKDTIDVEYDKLVTKLRHQVDVLSAENNQLRKTQTRLQAQVRGLELEKDTLEWTARRQKEREEALSQQVKELEDELGKTRERTQAMMKSMESTYHEKCQTEKVNEHQNTLPQVMQVDAQRIEGPPSLHPSHNKALDPVSNVNTEDIREARQISEMSRTNKRDNISLCSARQQVNAHMTDEEREALRERERGIIDQLEAELLTHSQKRDDLINQLQRLESVRLRTAADRHRKVQVETELAGEQKKLGSIRLQLRAHASLAR